MNERLYSIFEYEDNNKEEWDSFVDKSRNGTFLYKIDYLHYHKQKFIDCSLIIKKGNDVVAVLPGNIVGNIFYSHQGLTYGGFLILKETKVEEIITYFQLVNSYLKEKKSVSKVIYKTKPYIYSTMPSQEDEYALFLLKAKIISGGIASVINQDDRIPFSKSRKGNIKKAKKFDLEIKENENYQTFWDILKANLESTHNAKPVHSIEEIMKLKKFFPDNIKLFSVYLEEKCIAGALIYVSGNVAHVQYISASSEGKKISALDYLFDYLINIMYKDIKFFDFGTSTENNGLYLNEGLSFQKQGFGGRGVLYTHYEYVI